MRRKRLQPLGLFLTLIAIAIIVAYQYRPVSTPPAPSGESHPAWEVYFSPDGGCTEAIIATVSQAETSILVQAYSFTSAPIAKALLEAKKRGVRVEVILDESQRTAKYSEADFFAHAGIPTFIDAAHAIAHNKVMVINSTTVITGSFNFTKAAEERNAENLLILHDKALATRYTENWNNHKAHSESYAGR